ncbi:flagellar M-ring protein FliF [Altererythrobacter atlanticus]|uniref:Flagellar M-ring protein n=1 Tax=Croceibacterium atlanticum TaxID=1267766 RepID=A0A0F7KY46_9SPHN|nr:flagellar basal-body MS-ring/collar protein FliF [Croceibacterium atlanticum]AKH44166.1 Flagellar M-ring protein [Croceibacterium atlanticum]MBB5732477.1 flagellar M-ring protein FliF [Croceibacterium atlanticum]
MSDLVPAAQQGSILQPLSNPAGGSMPNRLKAFTAQPAIRRALPWFAGLAGIGLLALTWATMAPAPQRVLYSSLSDNERAEVVAALEKGSVNYQIDSGTGVVTVDEGDLYRARMLVASDGALATPESGAELLDSLPMGASRTLEGDRLRAANERELTLTISEIDGVEAVRVHLAQADRSVFVRDNIPPSASVMVRMARGRQLSDSQVMAIANLVAGSVPGLAAEAVRIVDQHGRLLSQIDSKNSDRLELQARMEEKLRLQVEQLLAPMIGAENFSTEIQAELDMDEVTSARESYDKDGAVRRETVQETSSSSGPGAAGVPGVMSNTPPSDAQVEEGAPNPGRAAGAGAAGPRNDNTSSSRTYELGREVAVSNTAPGTLKRLSVAVALNEEAMKGAKPEELEKIKELVSAAVGANEARGDNVAVMVRPFQKMEVEPLPFWETAWFATVLRNVVALISVLLVLLLVVRPVVKSLTRGKQKASEEGEAPSGAGVVNLVGQQAPPQGGNPAAPPQGGGNEQLTSQIELAQRIVREKPDDALEALRRMLGEPDKAETAR